MYLGGYFFLIRGLIKGHAQNEDVFIGEAMTSKMFMDQETGIGLDLAAQILQQEGHQLAHCEDFKQEILSIH